MIGIDILEVERVDASDSLLNKIACVEEIEYIKNSSIQKQKAAALFAVKEAVLKALGRGIGDVNFKDIQLCHKASGSPYIKLHGKALEIFKSEHQEKRIEISLSHTKLVVVAVAIII